MENIIENIGCIKSTIPSEYFPEEFLNNPLFMLLPDGYDVCYHIMIVRGLIAIHFYLYDSTVPLERINAEDIVSSIHIYFNQPYRWSYSWTPLYYNILHIPELVTNDNLEGFDNRGAGLGSFMILCAIAYSKSMNLHYAHLSDASTGFRTDSNIYTKLGFQYMNSTNHEMIGKVDEIFDKIDIFINDKKTKMITKLNELDEYFYDEEWNPSMEGGKKEKLSRKKSNRNKERSGKKSKRKNSKRSKSSSKRRRSIY